MAKCSPSSHQSYNILQVGRRRKVTNKGKSEHLYPGGTPSRILLLSHWPEICHVITGAARERGILSNFKSHIMIWMEMETCESGRMETIKPFLGLVSYEPDLECAALLLPPPLVFCPVKVNSFSKAYIWPHPCQAPQIPAS